MNIAYAVGGHVIVQWMGEFRERSFLTGDWGILTSWSGGYKISVPLGGVSLVFREKASVLLCLKDPAHAPIFDLWGK